MVQEIIKNYVEKYFFNLKDKELKDFYAHGLFCEKAGRELFNEILNAGFFNADERNLYKKYEKMLYIAENIHDIGNFVPGDKTHNKRGAKFILKNKIDNLTEEENLIVASIVRFHRGKSPKDKNKLYGILNSDLKAVVRLYAGILRISDVLDYGHYEVIEKISVKEDKRKGILVISTDCDLSNNVGFNLVFKKKRKLLSKVLNRKIILNFNLS